MSSKAKSHQSTTVDSGAIEEEEGDEKESSTNLSLEEHTPSLVATDLVQTIVHPKKSKSLVLTNGEKIDSNYTCCDNLGCV